MSFGKCCSGCCPPSQGSPRRLGRIHPCLKVCAPFPDHTFTRLVMLDVHISSAGVSEGGRVVHDVERTNKRIVRCPAASRKGPRTHPCPNLRIADLLWGQVPSGHSWPLYMKPALLSDARPDRAHRQHPRRHARQASASAAACFCTS